MSQVMQPEKKKNVLSQILPIAGAAVGTIYGGPAGGLKGYGTGSAVSGGIESVTDKNQGQTIQADQNPMNRRMNQIQEDPTNTLREAKQSLAYMPPDIQQQYQKPIDDAYALALEQNRRNKERGMA